MDDSHEQDAPTVVASDSSEHRVSAGMGTDAGTRREAETEAETATETDVPNDPSEVTAAVVVRPATINAIRPRVSSGTSASATADVTERPTESADERALAEAIGQIQAPKVSPPEPVPSSFADAPKRRIALINQKGGVGKTTTTVNLGVALQRLGRRVLLVDLDPQAHLTLSLGIDPQALDATMYDLLVDGDRSGFEVVREADSGVAVLPADVNLAGVEAELAAQVVTGTAQTRLKDSCAGLMEQFDDVLIDCPPALGLLTINGLLSADEVIVPMQAHYLALQGFSKLLETVSMLRRGLNSNLSVAGVVLCMYEGNTLLANEVVGEVKGFLESARGTDAPWADAVVFDPPIRRNIKLAEAPSFGQSVFDYAAESNGAKDYEKLAKSVMQAAVDR